MCYLGILPYFLDEKKVFSRCLSAKDAIRKSVEADNPFLEHRLFSAQTEKNISSRKYMAQMGNVSGGKEMVEFTSGRTFCTVPNVGCLAFSRSICFTGKHQGEEERPVGSYQSEKRYYLHIQLLDIVPPIWRRVVVPGAISLHTLHKMFQVTMGWENAHLYLFRLTINEKTTVYGLPDPDWDDAGLRIRDSRRTKLDATVWAEWLKLTYEYDLGDSWMHQITVERIEHVADESVYEDALWITPRCLAGERACPPEDAGGVGGYTLLLEALQNPRHPEHEQMRQWAGMSYDSELFSVQQVNSALANLD